MCVIPWKTEEDARNIFDKEEEWSRALQVGKEVILIKKFDSSQFEKKKTNVSYDLRVGEEYRYYGEARKRTLKEGKIELRPGRAAIILTEEEIRLPKSVFGLSVPKESKLQEGIWNVPTKVDPGYPGPLHITVANLGKKTATLERREAFCALVLFSVGEGVSAYEDGPKGFVGDEERGGWGKLKDQVAANPRVVQVVATLIAAILGLTGAVIYLCARLIEVNSAP